MQVLICDVGPRDGLQNEPEVLPPETRAELVDRLAAAGLRRIEAVSFVREDRKMGRKRACFNRRYQSGEWVRVQERENDVWLADIREPTLERPPRR